MNFCQPNSRPEVDILGDERRSSGVTGRGGSQPIGKELTSYGELR